MQTEMLKQHSVWMKIATFVFLCVMLAQTALSAAPIYNGVRYELKGVLIEDSKGFTLHTRDGRVFLLDVSPEKVKPFLNRWVSVHGNAHAADKTEILKVSKISQTNEPAKPVFAEELYSYYQKPAKLASRSGSKYTIDNVRWGIRQDPEANEPKSLHSWTTAAVDAEKVDQVFMVVLPMKPEVILAHAILVFTFKPGGFVNKSGSEAQALTVTIEAALPPGEMYDLAKTVKKTFNMVWNLTTFENYARMQVQYNKSEKRLIFYKVNLNEAQKKQLLQDAIAEACKNRRGEFYHITRNNCINNLVILLNRVLDEKLHMWWIPNALYNMTVTAPIHVFKTLMQKGIISDAEFELNRSNLASYFPAL